MPRFPATRAFAASAVARRGHALRSWGRLEWAESDELRLSVANDLGEIARASEQATELLEREGAGASTVYAVQLALEEVLSNVVRHAYEDFERHEIEIAIRIGVREVEIEIVDDGRAFDPLEAPEPDLGAPLAERRAGGLGIHLLRAYVREIRYERRAGRNALRLRI